MEIFKEAKEKSPFPHHIGKLEKAEYIKIILANKFMFNSKL